MLNASCPWKMAFLLVAFVLQACVAHQQDIHVDKPGMLEDILCNATGLSSVSSQTVLSLNTSFTHHISRSSLCLLENMDEIAIVSSDAEKAAEISCNTTNMNGTAHSTAGIGFYNVSNLKLSNIAITNCGSLLSEADINYANHSYSPFYFGESAAAVFLFNLCRDVTVERVNISNYYGFAILTINMLGESHFVDLNVQISLGLEYESRIPPNHFPDNVGSGILLYYLDSNVSLPANINSSVGLSRLTLVHNWNYVVGYRCIEDVFPGQSQQFSRAAVVSAAGLSVIFSQESFSVEVFANGCNFTSNFGTMTAAVLLLFFNQAYTSHVSFNNSLFTENVNLGFCCRGAAIVAYFYYTRFQQCESLSLDTWRPLDISHTNISKQQFHLLKGNSHTNCSNGTGAVHVAMTYQCMLPVQISFRNVNFDRNHAVEDGACLYARTTDTLKPNAQRLHVLLEDIQAFQNGQLSLINPEGSLGSMFTFMNVIANVAGTSSQMPSTFHKNNGSVISAFQTLIHLQGFLSFYHNIARNGAVFNLAVSSQLVLHENLKAVFSNNQAKNYGGAIYKAYEDNKEDVCVIQVHSSNFTSIENINIQLNFINNTARLSGQSIFATPVYSCQQVFIPIAPSNYSLLYGQIFNFDDHEAKPTVNASFVSNPVQMEVIWHDIKSSVLTYPGQNHTLCVAAYDQDKKNVYTIVQIDLGYSDEHAGILLPVPWYLQTDQYMQTLRSDQECTNVTLDFLLPMTDFNTKESESVLIVLALPGTSYTKTLPLQLKAQCPIGFAQSTSHGACSDCSPIMKNFSTAYPYLDEIKCNLANRSFTKPVEVWISIEEDNGQPSILKIASTCPVGYCNPSEPIIKEIILVLATTIGKEFFVVAVKPNEEHGNGNYSLPRGVEMSHS